MKLICVNDREEVEYKTGIFSSEKRKEKVDGITEGKTYSGELMALCNNSRWEGIDQSRTQINFEDYGFLIYDDNGEWECYDLYHFKPAE